MTISSPPPPRTLSEAQRVDFVRQVLAFAEGNIRSYDTKSQVALAAFVLSLTPLWLMLHARCAGVSVGAAVLVLVALIVSTIAAFVAVVWPAFALPGRRRQASLFYPHGTWAASTPWTATSLSWRRWTSSRNSPARR